MLILSLLIGSAASAAALGAAYYGARLVLTGDGCVPLTVRPERFGLAYEAVEFRTGDGLTIKGWFVPSRDSNLPDPGVSGAGVPPPPPIGSGRTILVCHGWGSNKGEVLEQTHRLSRDFNLLYFDFRRCGESEGDILSVGHLELRDFEAAVDFLKEKKPAAAGSLGLFGLSMGAMVGLTRRSGFKAAVVESPFSSHNQAVARYARVKRGIPYYPLLPLAFYWIRRRLGADPEQSSPERALPLLEKTPILGIFGEKDPLVTPGEGRRLFDRIPGPKELWVVPGAGHGECAPTAGPAYEAKLGDFFRRHL